MIEFTLSRVAVCSCGIVLLASVTGVLGGLYDNEESQMDDELAERIAHMLDVFESSDLDSLILDGSMILPEDRFLRVHDNFVELYSGERMHIATTDYSKSFELSWNGIVEITRRTSPRSS